jgi:hypothetical protein
VKQRNQVINHLPVKHQNISFFDGKNHPFPRQREERCGLAVFPTSKSNTPPNHRSCTGGTEEKSMQAEITREHRMVTDVWTYRWRSFGETGKIVRHRIVLGSVQQFPTEDLVRQTFAGIVHGINSGDIRVQASSMRMSELVEHFKQHELVCTNSSICRDFVAAEDDKRFSTIETYQGYLRSRILPRWGQFLLLDIKTVDIEMWLKTLTPSQRS